MNNIQMVDLKGQYNKIKDQIDIAPIHTETETSSQEFIIQKVKEFF